MIDIKKTYRTRDGRKVRIYATDGLGMSQVHGAIFECSDYWRQETWCSDGQLLRTMQSDSDLVEVRPRHKRTVWLNVYPDFECRVWNAKKDADNMADGVYKRLACIKVELDFEEGEGL